MKMSFSSSGAERCSFFLFLLAFLAWGCGGREIDRRDELGVEEEEEPYELVIVDSSRSLGAGPSKDEPAASGEKQEAGKEERGGEKREVFDPEGGFTVQVGVYKDPGKAGEIVRELSAAGYPAYALAGPDRKGVRVRIGYFRTREDAERFGRIFKRARKMDFWVDSRENERF